MKKLTAYIILCLSLTSCNFNYLPVYVHDRVKNLQVGMSMEEVVDTMGKEYEIVSARDNSKILAYTTNDKEHIYQLYMIDGLLTGWDKVRIVPHEPPHNGVNNQPATVPRGT